MPFPIGSVDDILETLPEEARIEAHRLCMTAIERALFFYHMERAQFLDTPEALESAMILASSGYSWIPSDQGRPRFGRKG